MSVSIKDLKPKEIFNLCQKYLTEHSARRLNFLVWGIDKDNLHFLSVVGKKLTIVNNVEIVYRLLKIRNINEYQIIRDLIENYICNYLETKVRNVLFFVRIDYLMSYLKLINYDMNKFKIELGEYFTGKSVIPEECMIEGKNLSRPIVVMSDDYWDRFKITNYSEKLTPLLKTSIYQNEEFQIDTLDPMKCQNAVDYPYDIKDEDKNKIVCVNLMNGLDIVSWKTMERLKDDPNFKLEEIHLLHSLTNIVNKMTSSESIILSIRIYLQVFLQNVLKPTKPIDKEETDE